jgi:hypothetical protein
MRRTRVTHALAKEVELSAVRDKLRHASISTTLILPHANDASGRDSLGAQSRPKFFMTPVHKDTPLHNRQAYDSKSTGSWSEVNQKRKSSW